jgi:F-type H+-transporting ATPase subunit epsilon
MFDKPFNIEIVTPRKVIFNGEVNSFSAPGIEGGFQVLFSHAPFLSAIGIGEVRVTTEENTELKFSTSGGFVEVKNNKVVMLAETIESLNEIDVKRAEAAKERALARLKERKTETDVERAEVALQRALNRIRLAQRN